MSELRKGVSGILRVKNDALFIKQCVESCIAALDELVVVFNDCSDNSEAVIEEMRQKYPDKINVYEYKPKVYGTNLTRDEYEWVRRQPNDSPHLLCNYYNFALSKVGYMYALKIDADQIYFTDNLKKWCDFCREVRPMRYNMKCFIGWLFQSLLSLFRLLSMKCRCVLPILPQRLVSLGYPAYLEYSKYLFSRGKACLSMSGVNVIECDGKQNVSLGGQTGEINLLPPFNGEGDHVIFKVSKQTYYQKFDMWYYNCLKSTNYSLIEIFKHPYRLMYVGFFWVHVSAMRPSIKDKVLAVKSKETFMPIRMFVDMRYKDILKVTDKNMFNMFQRILFAFIYKANRLQLKESLCIC